MKKMNKITSETNEMTRIGPSSRDGESLYYCLFFNINSKKIKL